MLEPLPELDDPLPELDDPLPTLDELPPVAELLPELPLLLLLLLSSVVLLLPVELPDEPLLSELPAEPLEPLPEPLPALWARLAADRPKPIAIAMPTVVRR